MNKIFVEASTCEDSDILHCAESVLKSLDGILSLVPLPPVLYKYELMVRGERSNANQDLMPTKISASLIPRPCGRWENVAWVQG